MALTTFELGKLTFVNISKGRLYTKEKEKEPQYFKDISGYIVKTEIKMDEFKGEKVETMLFYILDDGERYCLKMRTDSGYFRALVNCLKSGDLKEKFIITPNYKEVDGKPKTTCFVKQDGSILKHFHTKANQGDLPEYKIITLKGKEVVDSSNQLEYWKNWLSTQQWYTPKPSELEAKPTKETLPPDDFFVEEQDDLPF